MLSAPLVPSPPHILPPTHLSLCTSRSLLPPPSPLPSASAAEGRQGIQRREEKREKRKSGRERKESEILSCLSFLPSAPLLPLLPFLSLSLSLLLAPCCWHQQLGWRERVARREDKWPANMNQREARETRREDEREKRQDTRMKARKRERKACEWGRQGLGSRENG